MAPTPEEHERARRDHADEVLHAQDAILLAVQSYAELVKAGPGKLDLDPTDIAYSPSTVLIDGGGYKIETTGLKDLYRYDPVLAVAQESDFPIAHELMLSLSPHWEDRVRAAALRRGARDPIVLPDGFPCIYEPASSPKNAGVLRPRDSAWVVSADVEMLEAVLPLYRELWDAYESQWPHTPNRAFEVGRLDGLTPYGVYRPGTTPEQVIGQTMMTHDGMYRTARDHLKAMHPLHAQWTKGREERIAELAAPDQDKNEPREGTAEEAG